MLLALPTQDKPVKEEETNVVLRKRDRVMEEWETLQKECDELRKELADDKWLVVFRTVTEQADNMMASLEKILTQCQVMISLFERDVTISDRQFVQEFMWRVQRRNVTEPFIER